MFECSFLTKDGCYLKSSWYNPIGTLNNGSVTFKETGEVIPSAARIRKNEKERRKKIRRKRILLVLFVSLILLSLIAWRTIDNLFDRMHQVEIDEDDLGLEELDDTSNLALDSVINIALFGIDTREGDYEKSLSDTILIATVDFEHNKLKLASVMRDTIVYVPGKGYQRVNSAYATGGPSLAIKTLNTNLDLNITDFVTVNFEAMEKIVDSVGGVEIDVESREISALNGIILEVNRITSGPDAATIKKIGLQTLNGRQAVAYSRIRKLGNGDFDRTERQRTVLEQVLNKVLKDRSITKAMRFADSLLPYVQTSMSRKEILAIGTKVLASGATTLENTRIPLDDHVKNANINGAAVLLTDSLIDNVSFLHNFIYENDLYEPSKRLLEINDDMPTK